jgi:hypothetical protein
MENTVFPTAKSDNCFEIAGKIGLVRNILHDGSADSVTGYVLFEEFARIESLSSDPLDCRKLSICFVNRL